jgi:hypothetical protein
VHDLSSALPRPMPKGLLGLAMFFLMVGIASFLLSVGQYPGRTWGGLLVGTFLFLGVAQGGVIIAAVLKITTGNWGRGIARIAESLSAFLPVAWVLVAMIVLFGAPHLYEWVAHPVAFKRVWLSQGFVATRTLVSLGVLIACSLWFVRLSLLPDMIAVRGTVDAKLRGMYEKWTKGAGSAEQALERERRIHRPLAPALVLLYALVITFAAYDLLMSLDQHWSSTMFGGWIFMSCLYTAWATTWFLALMTRARRPALDGYIHTGHLHDLGKLTFGWCMIWTYLFMAQFLPIWYANMPEEAHYVVARLRTAWRPASFTVLFLCFVLPFLGMMTKWAKVTAMSIGFFFGVIMLGTFLQYIVLVMPTFGTDTAPIGLPEVGIPLGVLGLFMLCVGWFRATFPIVPIANPPQRHGHHADHATDPTHGMAVA